MTTPSQDGFSSPKYPDTGSPIILPKRRPFSPTGSLASLPFRRSNSSLTSLFASTSSLPPLGGTSGSATPPASTTPTNTFSPGVRSSGSSPGNAPHALRSNEAISLILRSFVPHVAVFASADTEELVRQKGFSGGLLELLRPFGEHVPGKVTIRDSVGASRSWEDFGVRFTGLMDGLGLPAYRTSIDRTDPSGARLSSASFSRTGGDVAQIEEVVDRHLAHAEYQSPGLPDYFTSSAEAPEPSTTTSPFYMLYLRRLLSGLPMTPHETFAHPTACVIAISSKAPAAIEELRRLYNSTNSGDHRLPQWVNNEYLRYYVLVHDEDHDDIQKSTALFEQMKRHFGLHCHLLRIRSDRCVSSDEDSVRLPVCEWMSAAEELAEIQKRETADDLDDPTPYLFDSDVTAIRTFVRELVTQSIIPVMERVSAQWNEQILSRRRGLSGRLMSISKRWTPFGGSNRNSSPASTGGGTHGNYDSLQGFYRPDAPEAIMRKLADYAVMLRDFKLAHATYDLLRTDFANDKAWRYYAGAHEMTALTSLLLSTQALGNSGGSGSGGSRSARAILGVADNVDTLLETASYSYVTRCAAPYSALRCLALGFELLHARGGAAADEAARWASRILESQTPALVGPVGRTLFVERVGACYAAKRGWGGLRWGARRRKAGLWCFLAADGWVRLGRGVQAERALREACRLYRVDLDALGGGELRKGGKEQGLGFEGMLDDLEALREAIRDLRLDAMGLYDADADEERDLSGDQGGGEPEVEQEVEVSNELLDGATSSSSAARKHRLSLIGAVAPGMVPMVDPLGAAGEQEPPTPMRTLRDDKGEKLRGVAE